MYEIGLSTSGKSVCRDTFRMFSEAGIRFMEVSLHHDDYPGIDYKMLKKWSEDSGVRLWSFHLPFTPFSSLDLSKKELCRETVKYYCGMIEKASDIGIDKFVVHPSTEPIDAAERHDRMECSKESLFALAQFAEKCGSVVAVEDLPRTCIGNSSDEILELLAAHKALKVCFDTNHLLGEDVCDFVRKVGKSIVTVHVSDYDFVDEKHWLPGEGKTDWYSLAAVLKNVGYNGVWMYEVPFENTTKIQRSRNLTCDDFVRNAKEIFEGKELTVVK